MIFPPAVHLISAYPRYWGRHVTVMHSNLRYRVPDFSRAVLHGSNGEFCHVQYFFRQVLNAGMHRRWFLPRWGYSCPIPICVIHGTGEENAHRFLVPWVRIECLMRSTRRACLISRQKSIPQLIWIMARWIPIPLMMTQTCDNPEMSPENTCDPAW